MNLSSFAASVGLRPHIFAASVGSQSTLFASPSDLVCGPLHLPLANLRVFPPGDEDAADGRHARRAARALRHVIRWVVTYRPPLEAAFHRRKRPVWRRWRLDETDRRVKGHWSSLARAVDQTGQTIDFLLTEHRDEHAAVRFLMKAIRRHSAL
jgi:hypothetical protein